MLGVQLSTATKPAGCRAAPCPDGQPQPGLGVSRGGPCLPASRLLGLHKYLPNKETTATALKQLLWSPQCRPVLVRPDAKTLWVGAMVGIWGALGRCRPGEDVGEEGPGAFPSHRGLSGHLTSGSSVSTTGYLLLPDSEQLHP